jgi:hypothetical protein
MFREKEPNINIHYARDSAGQLGLRTARKCYVAQEDGPAATQLKELAADLPRKTQIGLIRLVVEETTLKWTLH